MIVQFVGDTARILRKKGRLQQFVFLADRSIVLLQGNLILIRYILLQIIIDSDIERHECADVLKYYLAVEKMLDDSVQDKTLKMGIFLKIGKAYIVTGQYRKTLEYTLKAEEIAIEVKHKQGEVCCYTTLGNAYFKLSDYENAITYFEKGLEISSAIGDRSAIAANNGNLGIAYYKSGKYETATKYYEKGLEISSAIEDRSGIASNNGYLGNAYYKLGKYQNAIMHYQKSLEICRTIGNRSEIARMNMNLGNVYNNLGVYEKAFRNYQKGLEIFSVIEDRSGIASSNVNLGNVYSRVGEYEKAITYYQEGLENISAIGDRSEIASANGNLGIAYHNLGEYEKAIVYFQKGLEISSALGDQSGIAFNNGNLGNAYQKVGEYEKAIVCHQKGLKISSAIGDRLGIASKNEYLGNAYFSSGKYENAIKCYEKGLETSSAIGDRSGVASTTANLSIAYGRLGENEKPITKFMESLEIYNAIGDSLGKASSIINLGDTYCNLGQYEKAIMYYEKGLEISSAIGNRSVIAVSNNKLGKSYSNLGKYEKAITYHQESLEISSAIGYRAQIAQTNANLGDTYIRLGQYEKGIEFLMEGLNISVEIGDPILEGWCLANVGINYLSEAQTTFDKPKAFSICLQAVSYITRSVHCIDKIFSNLIVDQNKISFAKNYFDWYVILMLCFNFLKRIEAALLVIDLGKAKALNAFREKVKNQTTHDTSIDLTWNKIDNNEEKIRTEEIQEALELKSNSSVLLYAFDYDNFLNIWVLNSEDGVKTFKHNELVLGRIDVFSKFLLTNCNVNLNRDSSFHKLDSGFTPGYQTFVPDQLDKRSVKDKLIDATKLGQSETISSSRFRPNQQSDESKIFNHTSATVDLSTKEVFQSLYEVLIHPVKELIKGTKIIIVPDKTLFFVPFCSLLDENFCRLSENYSIQITPSLHTLVSSMTQSRDSGLGFALFVGNPTVGKVSFRQQEIEPSLLPSASIEVRHLAPLFETQPLVEGEATKEKVLKCIQGSSIIHIAAHGEQDSGEIFLAPNRNITEQSSSPPNENSYLLKQRDVMKIAINARLVVLCCCHTGQGKISSEGVVGLARAFLCAGARSVLATLWRIHDEGTKEFMKIFYDEICNETSVCQALRRAMIMFQRHENEEFRSFKIWAPFTIYGEDVSFTRDDIEEIKRKSREMNF